MSERYIEGLGIVNMPSDEEIRRILVEKWGINSLRRAERSSINPVSQTNPRMADQGPMRSTFWTSWADIPRSRPQ